MQKQWKGDKIARMEIQDLKRYSAAEVVLLGVFALGLLLALVLVKVRGNIALAEPVALPFGGVSAPLPQGPEWKTVGGWMYESDNSFVLLGIMNYQGRPAMTARWRYALCDEPVEVEALLRQRADSAAARLTLLGQTGGSLAMSYGRIDSPGTRESYLMGVAVLEQARRLELYIAFGSQDEAFAQTVFEALANGVRLSPCPQQAAGAEQVEQFYRTRLQSLADADAPRQTVLLLKDAAERPLGYASQRAFVHNSGDGDGHLRLTTLRVEAAGLRSESDLWLSFTDTAFSWKAVRQLADSGAPRTNELRGNTAGRIAVQRSGEGNRMLCRTPMLMYEPLTTAFVAGLPADDAGPIVIDLLTETGMVVPVRISPIAAQDAHVKSEQAVRFVRLDYLHTDGAFEEMVFDADGALLGRFEQAPSRPARLWEATTPDALKQTFGVQLEPLGRAPDSSQPAAPLKTETLAMKEQTTTQTAVFAAGCFWGVEYFFAAVAGVV